MRQSRASIEVLLGLDLSISDPVVILRLTPHQDTFSGVSHRSPSTLDHWRRNLSFTTENSPTLRAAGGRLC